jgi:hypothetical protein
MEKCARDVSNSKQMIVHFCFGMTPDFGGRPFGFSHYLAVRSAWEVLEPDVILMHYVHEPQGHWWELARPYLHLHKVRPVAGIYGFPASHPAHRADIIRLAALIAMGGIYLDTDVLVVRPFGSLGDPDFAAAWEFTADGRLVGLSNAVLAAKAGSRFAQLCLEGHDPKKSLWSGFRANGKDHNYVEMSVRYPAMLASLCPTMVKTLPQETFLWADWSDEGLGKLFEQDVEVPDGVLALHLWESHAWEKYLKDQNPESVRSGKTTFAAAAQRFLPDVIGRKAPNLAETLCGLDFQKMDAICEEVDFVNRERTKRGLLTRVTRKASSLLAKFKNNLLRIRHKAQTEILVNHLPEEPYSVLMISDSDAHCDVCELLALQPMAEGVFSIGNLKSARDKNSGITGSSTKFRIIHHDIADSSSARKIIETTFEGMPDLVVCCEGTQLAAEDLGYQICCSSPDGRWMLLGLKRKATTQRGRLKKIEKCISIYGDEVTKNLS